MNLIIAILPILLIGFYIYKRDREKESSKLLLKLFAGGIVSCFPAAITGVFLGSFFPAEANMSIVQLFVYVFFVVACVEEVCKWFILYQISYNDQEFDTLYDMILYASFVALGFACFENILYVYESGLVVGILRAITAVPGHVCDGILMGYYLGLAKYNHVKGNNALSKKFMWMSLFVPVVTHGIYDFCLFLGYPLFVLIFVLFVVILFIVCIKKINNISKNDIKFIYNSKYCTGCGTLITSNYCTKCGKKHN